MTHHLHARTRLPSGIGLNEPIPNEEKIILNVSLKHITFHIFIAYTHRRLNEKRSPHNPALVNNCFTFTYMHFDFIWFLPQ